MCKHIRQFYSCDKNHPVCNHPNSRMLQLELNRTTVMKMKLATLLQVLLFVSQHGIQAASVGLSIGNATGINPGDKKINVLKVVKESTGLGLAEAKDLVASAGKSVPPNLPGAAAAKQLLSGIEDSLPSANGTAARVETVGTLLAAIASGNITVSSPGRLTAQAILLGGDVLLLGLESLIKDIEKSIGGVSTPIATVSGFNTTVDIDTFNIISNVL